MKNRDFLNQINELAETLRRTIEAECTGFEVDPVSSQNRVIAVLDKDSGFEFFVNNYFPHYIKRTSKSQLHVFLFDTLPQIIKNPKSEQLAIAAPRGEAKSTIVSQLFVS